jgi:DNA-binding response OmpR family regulator
MIKKILLIDDEPLQREIVKDYLSNKEYAFLIPSSPFSAVIKSYSLLLK